MALPSSILQRSTRALQPAAAAANTGIYYYVTDEDVLEQSTGAVWASVSLNSASHPQNHIMNGSFVRGNRQAEGTLATYSETAGRRYFFDRWAVTNENASIQAIRLNQGVTAPETGLRSCFYGGISKITSTGKIVISQTIEQMHAIALRGQTVRLQLRMKASSAKTIRVALLQLASAGSGNVIPGYVAATGPSGTFVAAFGANATDPTFGTNLAKIAPVVVDNATSANTGLTCAVTTAWQRFGGTFTVPTDCRNLVLVVFTDSQFAAADVLYLTEVGLYLGAPLRAWVDNQVMDLNGQVLPSYQKSFSSGVLPGQNAGMTGAQFGTVSVAGANANLMSIRFAYPLRSSVFVPIFYNPSNTNAFVRNITRSTDASATAVTANVGNGSMEVSFTGLAAWTIGDLVAVHYTVEAEL